MVESPRQVAHRREMILRESAIMPVTAALKYLVYKLRPALVVASGIVKKSQHAQKVSLQL